MASSRRERKLSLSLSLSFQSPKLDDGEEEALLPPKKIAWLSMASARLAAFSLSFSRTRILRSSNKFSIRVSKGPPDQTLPKKEGVLVVRKRKAASSSLNNFTPLFYGGEKKHSDNEVLCTCILFSTTRKQKIFLK